MENLMDIHTVAKSELQKRFSLQPVQLKHPFPERPLRALGLMKINGEVFSSDKLLRVVFIRPQLPVFFAVRSMFIRPRMELDLPVFAGEVMRTGKKKMLIVDIHRTGKTHHDDSELFEKMIQIRNQYPELTRHTKKQSGEIQEVFSRGSCQVVIPQELESRAVSVFVEYLKLFCDLVDQSQPVSGEELARTQAVFEDYLATLVDHDPGVGVWKMLFGKKGGVERSMDMHFGR
ncbi:hypothetical protein ACFL43_04900 [Thermodesulfobacteriota bacterium]